MPLVIDHLTRPCIFVNTGQVLANTTLFTYKPGENISTFSNASFVPIFLDEPINFASDALRIQAELACQGHPPCLFDIASTGDVSAGAATKAVSVELENQAQALREYSLVLFILTSTHSYP